MPQLSENRYIQVLHDMNHHVATLQQQNDDIKNIFKCIMSYVWQRERRETVHNLVVSLKKLLNLRQNK